MRAAIPGHSRIWSALLARLALVGAFGALGASAQNPATDFVEVGVGAEVYAKNCANQYCHGAAGKAGKAPAVAERGLDRGRLARVIREGIPNTSMPGWDGKLTAEEVQAVVTYVTTLQATVAKAEELSPDRPSLRHPGRALFFDPARIGSCGVCHHIDGWGIAVAPALAPSLPDSVTALRAFPGNAIRTSKPDGQESFPALLPATKSDSIQVYDMGGKLPVLRTFPPELVTLTPGSSWKHSEPVSRYTDEELTQVLDFLRLTLQQSP